MSSVIIYSPKTNKPMYQITILPFNTMVTRLSDAATTIVHDNTLFDNEEEISRNIAWGFVCSQLFNQKYKTHGAK
jgi:hypothetical protein